MKSSRGRWSVYQILKANEYIEPYLVKTALFNQEAFYGYSHQHLVIRPCFGLQKISVSTVNRGEELYQIRNNNNVKGLYGKSNVFQHLMEICNEGKFYILQDMSFLGQSNSTTELFVTINKGVDGEWGITSVLDKNSILTKWELYLLRKKFQRIAIETASWLSQHFPECPTFVLEIVIIKEKLWIQDVTLHFSKSKWSQHQILTSLKELSPYLPHTELATPMIFLDTLQKYKQVMLKPCHGQWGLGIAKVTVLEEDVFEVRHERRQITINGKKEIINYLYDHFLLEDHYIIQEGINLATIEDCIFDTRVMVQREDNNSEWEITAKVVKVARKNFIVTNVASSILLLEDALQVSSIKNISFEKVLAKIDSLCLAAAKLLEEVKEINTIGMDVGIDDKGDIWLFETNLVPDISFFKRLEDKSIYKKIKNKKNKHK